MLAGGHGQLPLLGELAGDLVVQRGQLTHLPEAPWQPAVPVAGGGYTIADGCGGVWCGATAQDGDLDPALREADQAENLLRYAQPAAAWATRPRRRWPAASPGACSPPTACPSSAAWPRPGRWPSNCGCSAPARASSSAPPSRSRGIGWAALAGRLVAALALGSPRPLEAELLDAVDPLRFALRRRRRPGR